MSLTDALVSALKSLDVVRTGHVARNPDGTPLRDGQTTNGIQRVCRKAGLVHRVWHPFRLQAWMGHARMDEALLYVHLAQAHPRPLPPAMIEAAAGELDPDRRVLVMLSARTPKLGHGPAATPFGFRPLVRRCHSVPTKPEVTLKAVRG